MPRPGGVTLIALRSLWSPLATLGPARLRERWLGQVVSGAFLRYLGYLNRSAIRAAFGRQGLAGRWAHP